MPHIPWGCCVLGLNPALAHIEVVSQLLLVRPPHLRDHHARLACSNRRTGLLKQRQRHPQQLLNLLVSQQRAAPHAAALQWAPKPGVQACCSPCTSTCKRPCLPELPRLNVTLLPVTLVVPSARLAPFTLACKPRSEHDDQAGWRCGHGIGHHGCGDTDIDSVAGLTAPLPGPGSESCEQRP